MPLNCAVSTRSPTYTFIELGTASELVLPQPFYYVTWAWVGCQVEIFVFSSGNWWDLNLGSFDWQSSALTTWPHSCMVVWLYCLQTHSEFTSIVCVQGEREKVLCKRCLSYLGDVMITKGQRLYTTILVETIHQFVAPTTLSYYTTLPLLHTS